MISKTRIGKKVTKMASNAMGLIIRSQYLGEPNLVFAAAREHVDPKLGISRFGPKSYSPRRRHPVTVRVGFIGTADTIAATGDWIKKGAEGVPGDAKHPEFPGCMTDRGYFSDLELDPDWNAQLYQNDVEKILAIRRSRDRFESLLLLLEAKLRFLSQKDRPPEYIVVAMPDELYRQCHAVNYRDRYLGKVHRDLRWAFKAIAMQYRIPTQLIRQQTIDG